MVKAVSAWAEVRLAEFESRVDSEKKVGESKESEDVVGNLVSNSHGAW